MCNANVWFSRKLGINTLSVWCCPASNFANILFCDQGCRHGARDVQVKFPFELIVSVTRFLVLTPPRPAHKQQLLSGYRRGNNNDRRAAFTSVSGFAPYNFKAH